MLSDSENEDLRLAREERLARERQIAGEKRPAAETFTHPDRSPRTAPAAKKPRRQEKVSKEIASGEYEGLQPWQGLIAQDHLPSLPNEIWEEICKQLKPQDLMALKRTNKLANRFVSQAYTTRKLKYLHCYQDEFRTNEFKPDFEVRITVALGYKIRTSYQDLYINALKNLLGEELFELKDFKWVDKFTLLHIWPIGIKFYDVEPLREVVERGDVALLRMLMKESPHFAVKVLKLLINLTAGLKPAMNEQQKQSATLFTALISALDKEAVLYKLFLEAIDLKGMESEFTLRYFIDKYPHFLSICEDPKSKFYPIIRLLNKTTAGSPIRKKVAHYMIEKSPLELRKAYFEWILTGDFYYNKFRHIITEGLTLEELLSMAENSESHRYKSYILLHEAIVDKSSLIEYIKCSTILQNHPKCPHGLKNGGMLKDLAPGWTIEKLEDVSSLKEYGHELLLAATENSSFRVKIENHLKSRLTPREARAVIDKAKSLRKQGEPSTTSSPVATRVPSISSVATSAASMNRQVGVYPPSPIASKTVVSTSDHLALPPLPAQANVSHPYANPTFPFFRRPNTPNIQGQQEQGDTVSSEKANSPHPN